MGKKKKELLEEDIEEEEIEEDSFGDEEKEEEGISTVNLGDDLSDVSYEEFSKAHEISEDEMYEEPKEESTEKEEISETVEAEESGEQFYGDENVFISILSFFWTWFRRLGIAIAIVLSAYYVAHGMFKDLFFYLLMLVAAYFFGYGFMFVFTHFTENR